MKLKHVCLLMLIEAAILTNPRQSDHAGEIYQAATNGMTRGILSDLGEIGAEKYVVSRKNYILFSTGQIGQVTVSIGAFGYVKTNTDLLTLNFI